MFFERLFRYSKTVPVIRFSCRRLYEHRWISLWNRYVSPHTFVRLLDLGARNGLKEAAVFAPLRYLKNASAVGVEPDEEEAERLRRSGEYEKIFAEGVAGYTGEAVLHVLNPFCSSIKRVNKALLDDYGFHMDLYRDTGKRVPVQVKTLDDLLGGDKVFDFIKIDIHGVEYEVLASMSDALLKKTTGIYVETRTVPFYEGEHTLDEIAKLMKDRGFCWLFSRDDSEHPFCSEYDVFFVKDPRTIRTVEQALKHCLAGLLVGRFEYVRYILRFYKERYGACEVLDTFGRKACRLFLLSPEHA